MKKLGKKSKMEKGTFMSYACNCGCSGNFCSVCKNCNYSTPQAVGAVFLREANSQMMNTKAFTGLVYFG